MSIEQRFESLTFARWGAHIRARLLDHGSSFGTKSGHKH